MDNTRAIALREAIAQLTAAGVETPDRDARLLMQWTEGIDAAALIASPEIALSHPKRLAQAIEQRSARKPVSKIIGYRDFWSHRFIVTPDVLDPRPETETIIEAVLDITPRLVAPKILDLGTGSGCILLTLLSEFTLSQGVGIDSSPAALSVAKQNAEALGVADRAKFLLSNWFEALDDTFDLVVCNPPYISTSEGTLLAPEVARWDPEAALFAGMDGLHAYRGIANGLATVLKPDGVAFFEVGIGQSGAVTDLLREVGFGRITSRLDLAGVERCIIARR